VDKAGNVHVPVGKRSFAAEHLGANASAIIEALVKAKPVTAKGQYLRSVTVSTTMGPAVPVDVQRIASQYKL
jgi:large subunit ribosomal protein L1